MGRSGRAADCSVVNTSSAEAQLQLNFPLGAGGAVALDGKVKRSLGSLAPGGSMPLTLRWIPLLPGIHKVMGVQLIDVLTERLYDLGVLCDIFVHDEVDPAMPKVRIVDVA